MGLYDLLVNPPSGFKYYTGGVGNLSGNSFSTPQVFGQRTAPYPSNSTQPYIRIPIPPVNPTESSLNTLGPLPGNLSINPEDNFENLIRYNSKSWGPDFFTRGNLFGLIRSADDVKRLTKYFFDFAKPNGSISGLFFTLKQNALSSLSPGYNDEVYLPTSTIAQAGVSLFGFNLQKQGLTAGVQFSGSQSTPPDPSGIKENFINIRDARDREITTSTYTSLSPSYLTVTPNDEWKSGNIEVRTNFQSGGRRGNLAFYNIGKLDLFSSEPTLIGPTDKINALPIYLSPDPIVDDTTNDLINFRISILDNQSINSESDRLDKFHLHFRAYLDGFDDSYDATWNGIEYVGRAEKFYRYSGFNRTINIEFTLAASSRQELIPMYKKLNFLASSLAPSYSTNGYMMGNLAQITVGDYLYQQLGFIGSLNISVPESAPYEVNVGLDGKPIPDMRQLPMILTVKMKFTPLHEFRPEIATLNDPLQRYIALENAEYGTLNTYSDPPIEESEILSVNPDEFEQLSYEAEPTEDLINKKGFSSFTDPNIYAPGNGVDNIKYSSRFSNFGIENNNFGIENKIRQNQKIREAQIKNISQILSQFNI